ncbi:MAG: ABC transporter permease [Caldilineales bacterium]
MTKKAPSPSPVAWQARLWRSSWHLLAVPLLLLLALPIVAMLLRISPADLLANLRHTQVINAVNLSLLTSLITTAVTWVLGTPVAYLLAQPRFRFHRLLDTLIDLPTVLPPAVAGVALLMAFGRRGLFGPWLEQFGITLPFTTAAVVMAQTFVASSFYVKAAALGFAAIDPELKQAAALDGAGRVQVFRRITLPLSWAALLSGSVMTWARALGEFGATIIFAGNFPGRTQTMPLAIYVGFEIDQRIALTLAVILIAFSFLTLLVIKGALYSRLKQDA